MGIQGEKGRRLNKAEETGRSKSSGLTSLSTTNLLRMSLPSVVGPGFIFYIVYMYTVKTQSSGKIQPPSEKK
jgi:hypothetical protein